jgi:protein-tyrosine phosphatase
VSQSVLFVCLGNICRSPLAEAALKAEAERLGLDVEVDSAGTGDWHLGYPPDPRAAAVAVRNGIDISQRRARLVTPEDFARFDHVIALDEQNLANLQAMRRRAPKRSCRCCSIMCRGGRGSRSPTLIMAMPAISTRPGAT